MGLNTSLKLTEIGYIPVDWNVLPIEDMAQIKNGLTYSPSNVSQNGTLVLRSANIQNERLTFMNNVFVNCYVPDKHKVEKGDILICVRNGSRNLIGKCALINEKATGEAFGAFMAVLRSDFSDYLIWQFRSSLMQKQINEHLGATINQITNSSLKAFKVILPSARKEREAITEALSDADALIESLENLIEKKHFLFQTLFNQLMLNNNNLLTTTYPWKEYSFNEAFDFHSTATNSRSDLDDENGGVGYIHYGDVHTRYGMHLDCENKKIPFLKYGIKVTAIQLKKNDLIMADASEDLSGIGKATEIVNLPKDKTFVTGLHTYLLRQKKLIFEPRFQGYFFNSNIVKAKYLRVYTGMKVYGVSKASLRDITFKIPEISDQKKIIEILDPLDKTIEILENKLTKAKKIKTGMMQELLTGRTRLI